MRAVSSFFRDDPERILAVAAQFRARSRVVESVVSGWSMGSTLPNGSRIRIQINRRTDYRPGEILAFLPCRQVVVHRVVARGRGRGRGHLLTRGDSLVVPDPPVDRTRVLGPVTEVDGGDGWIPVGRREPGTALGSWARRVVLAVTASLLVASPEAAKLLVDGLRRLEATTQARRR